MLRLFRDNYTNQAILEIDSLDFVIGGTLFSIGEDGKLYSIAYYSRKVLSIKSNYEIYDKELLAIINYLEV